MYLPAQLITMWMLLYFFLTHHVPLGCLNNLTNPATQAQWRSTAAGVIPGVLVLACLEYGNRVAVVLGAVWLWLWFGLQVRQWWVPYLFGETALHGDFSWYRAGGYDRTARILPARGGRPTPDLQHMLLQALTLSAALVTTLTVVS